MIIKEVHAHKIKDSRSQETIEVSVNGCKASSPSGKSTGKYESLTYHTGLDWNINFINHFKEIKGLEINNFEDLIKIESLIKKKTGFRDVKQFGANALFAIESAILKALAKSQHKQLWQIINPKAKEVPIPLGNVIGGGLHSHNRNHTVFQEFLLIPKGQNIKENVKIMQNVYDKIKKLVSINLTKTNDEGALQTSLDEKNIISLLSTFKDRVNIGVDVAASTFYKHNLYKYHHIWLTSEQHMTYIINFIKKFNLFYIEDPLEQENFRGFSKILKSSYRNQSYRSPRTSVLVVGDDLTATQIGRLNKAIKRKSINAMIIKPNQNGSLLELKKIFDICKKNKIKTILSHRSGETLDNSLADYAFGFQADYIKCGITTKWREAKLQRLIEIKNLM